MSKNFIVKFPLSIEPEVVSQKIMYTKECYRTVMAQLDEGQAVYDKLIGTNKKIGETIGVQGNLVYVLISDKDCKEILSKTEEKLWCIGTSMDGEGETDAKSGILTINKAKVIRVAIILRVSISDMLDPSVFNKIIVAKERTFDKKESDLN